MMKLYLLMMTTMLVVGCGNNIQPVHLSSTSIGPVKMPTERVVVGQPAQFTIQGTNLPSDNTVSMTDCDALKIVEYVSGGITFSCTPTSIGKKTIILKKPSGEIAYQQQLDVFCPHQTIVTQGLCFKPDVTNAWQVKKPSASSGLFIKTTLSPSMIYEKGVMYSFDFGDGVSEGYRFSANAYEESEHQYKEAGTYSVTLRIYGDNYENAFIDKKTIEVDRVGHIVVSNYQPSMFETVKMWIVGVFEDVRKIVWGSGNTVSQPKDTTEAFSNSYELGLQTIT